MQSIKHVEILNLLTLFLVKSGCDLKLSQESSMEQKLYRCKLKWGPNSLIACEQAHIQEHMHK